MSENTEALSSARTSLSHMEVVLDEVNWSFDPAEKRYKNWRSIPLPSMPLRVS